MDPNGNMDRPARGAGKRPTDGAPYVVKEGYWYCELCWLYAWGDHVTSAKHLRRLAEYFDEQEDWRQMQWMSRGCPHRLLHVCRVHKALPRYPQQCRLLEPALQGPDRRL